MSAVRVDLLRDGLLRAPEPEAVATAAPPAQTPLELPCAFCDERAVSRCVQCERPACAAHRWVMYGLCRACLTTEELHEGRAAKDPPRPDLGIKWIQD